MFDNALIPKEAFEATIAHNVILLSVVVSGSHAYGTNTPDSDVDVRGVFVQSPEAVLGLRGCEKIKFGEDGLLHSLRSFVRLASAGNPNMLDWLFVPPDCVLFAVSQWRELQSRANMFVTNRVVPKILGYANGQLAKMTHAGREMGKKRREQIEKFGFSPKNAMHLIRLLRMAEWLCLTGEYRVRSMNPEDLLRIRRGEWSCEEIEKEARRLMAARERWKPWDDLPEFAGDAQVDELLVKMYLDVWKRAGWINP